jgi:hypothetical protein
VNTIDEAKRFSDWGVDGIITDNPKRLLSSQLERRI